ncbi:hypothetical protein MSAN_02309300 [Mycena sanguinolenta]|uniref:Uncharacterized protein n=1 Tax=Mycena sanguinolenta TaxID=230812 RepID=A0A8H6X8K6_9AGAR|nr:hypothetical protein MSAN_02309300 [Mycena sanguinolenta]
MANATGLPNPYTPLAFLPPALADQVEVSRYLYAATLGAYVWDIGLHLGNDYALLFKHRVRLPTIVYFLSRAFTLALILTTFAFQVASVEDCNALGIAVGICFVLSQTSTALLFFLRVTAIWHPSKIAYVVFSVLWLGVLGAGITVPLGVSGAHIGPTMQCITTTVRSNIEVSMIIPMINDTAIFLAINYRILAYTMAEDSPMAHLRALLGGTGRSALSRALLQSGQHFYLIAVITHIVLFVLLKLPHLPPIYHAMLTVPGFALINAMGCQVFRRIKFGLISSDGMSITPVTGLSVDFHATTNPTSLSRQFRNTNPITTESGTTTTFPLEVRMHTAVDEFENGTEASQEMSKPADFA